MCRSCDNLHRQACVRTMRKALPGGKRPRPHDLWHTCASWMIAAGDLSQHLGHESITTTVHVYGHLDRTSGARGRSGDLGDAQPRDGLASPTARPVLSAWSLGARSTTRTR